MKSWYVRLSVALGLFSGILAGVLTPVLRSKVHAETDIVCYVSSAGGAYLFSSSTSCPIPATLATTSFLYQYIDYLGNYYNVQTAYSGCALCKFDSTLDGNHGGAGDYYVQGYHYASIPGSSDTGVSFYVFSV